MLTLPKRPLSQAGEWRQSARTKRAKQTMLAFFGAPIATRMARTEPELEQSGTPQVDRTRRRPFLNWDNPSRKRGTARPVPCISVTHSNRGRRVQFFKEKSTCCHREWAAQNSPNYAHATKGPGIQVHLFWVPRCHLYGKDVDLLISKLNGPQERDHIILSPKQDILEIHKRVTQTQKNKNTGHLIKEGPTFEHVHTPPQKNHCGPGA